MMAGFGIVPSQAPQRRRPVRDINRLTVSRGIV